MSENRWQISESRRQKTESRGEKGESSPQSSVSGEQIKEFRKMGRCEVWTESLEKFAVGSLQHSVLSRQFSVFSSKLALKKNKFSKLIQII